MNTKKDKRVAQQPLVGGGPKVLRLTDVQAERIRGLYLAEQAAAQRLGHLAAAAMRLDEQVKEAWGEYGARSAASVAAASEVARAGGLDPERGNLVMNLKERTLTMSAGPASQKPV